jgi:hypothetical protein
MRKVTVSALVFAVLLAAAAPAGSQTRPRRVGPPPAPEVFSESGPRSRNEERAPGERERKGSRWRRVLFGAGLAAAAYGRAGRNSCTPSRRVFGDSPR